MKSRFNCYFSASLGDQLSELAVRQGIHRSQIVEAAVASYLSPDALDRREAAYARRLDHLSRQIERVERNLVIATESHALFVRFWLSVTHPLPESAQAAARAQGTKRYQQYIETLGRRLQHGSTLVREISEEIWPDQQTAGAPSSLDQAGEMDHASAI